MEVVLLHRRAIKVILNNRGRRINQVLRTVPIRVRYQIITRTRALDRLVRLVRDLSLRVIKGPYQNVLLLVNPQREMGRQRQYGHVNFLNSDQ